MWTSERGRVAQREERVIAQVGSVTLSQFPLGVYVDGERRNLPLYGPGGYSWRPPVGDSVLVMKREDGSCVVGALQQETELETGEVKISGGGGEVYLTSQGDVAITGTVKINGESIEDMIARIVSAQMIAL